MESADAGEAGNNSALVALTLALSKKNPVKVAAEVSIMDKRNSLLCMLVVEKLIIIVISHLISPLINEKPTLSVLNIIRA